MTDFHARHRDRLMDTVAFVDEFLDPTDDIEEIKAEYADARRCRDADLHRRTDQEAERREKAAARIAGLYGLLRIAGQQESESLSQEAALELRRTVQAEFSRRGGDASDNDNP